MYLILRKKRISEQALLVILILPLFIRAEFVSALEFSLFFILLIKSKKLVKKELAPKLMPLFFLLIIGLHGFIENSLYDFLKDFWYISKSIPQITIGFLLMNKIRSANSLLKIIIVASLIASFVHVSGFLYNQDLFLMDFKQIRNEYQRGFTLTVIGLSVIVAMKYYRLTIIRNTLFIPCYLLILSVSLFLSYSRTLWISLVIFFFVFINNYNSRLVFKVIVLLTIITVTLTIGYLTNMFQYIDTANTVTFIGKIFHSINEVIPKNYFSLSEINQNWRGYESYMAIKGLINSNSLIFGKGFGALTDLELYMLLGDRELRFIPILHNAYIYILLKTGLVGLSIYILFFYKLLFAIKARPLVRRGGYDLVCVKLYQGSIIVLIFSSFVISGIFNKSACNPLIILSGALFFFLSERTNRNFGSKNIQSAIC